MKEHETHWYWVDTGVGTGVVITDNTGKVIDGAPLPLFRKFLLGKRFMFYALRYNWKIKSLDSVCSTE